MEAEVGMAPSRCGELEGRYGRTVPMWLGRNREAAGLDTWS